MKPLANWKKEEDYPALDTRPLEIWVWEFLRRNPEYQKDWEEERALVSDDLSIMGKTADYAISLNATRNEKSYYLEKYGLPILLNPEISRPKNAFLKFEFSMARLYWRDSDGEIDDLISSNVVASLFDLNYPIKPQLLSVEMNLKEFQESRRAIVGKIPKATRLRPDKWIEFLRVLDAKKLGVMSISIASVLHPEKKNDTASGYQGSRMVRDYIKGALHMRDVGFRFILLQEGREEKEKKLKATKKQLATIKKKLEKLEKSHSAR